MFSTPQNYSEMVRKISFYVLFVSLIITILLSHFLSDVGDLMQKISLGLTFEIQGIELCISYIYAPMLISLLENIFKIHDRISDLLCIRYRFDKDVIIRHFLSRLKIKKLYKSINKGNRKQIMQHIFYKYASSTDPQIDRHLIDMALGAWCWYWILLDTSICILISGIIWLIFSFAWINVFVILVLFVVLYILMKILKDSQCCRYAKAEVDAILELPEQKGVIKRYLTNALQNR